MTLKRPKTNSSFDCLVNFEKFMGCSDIGDELNSPPDLAHALSKSRRDSSNTIDILLSTISAVVDILQIMDVGCDAKCDLFLIFFK